jgi:preprotein translocase subunit SecG
MLPFHTGARGGAGSSLKGNGGVSSSSSNNNTSRGGSRFALSFPTILITLFILIYLTVVGIYMFQTSSASEHGSSASPIELAALRSELASVRMEMELEKKVSCLKKDYRATKREIYRERESFNCS